jgi:hypothetical protein
VGLALALSTILLVGVAPASAAVIVVECNGTCGYYEITDNDMAPGARCNYANSFPYKLLNISTRPPLMHGNYLNNTKVGWKVRIQRKPINSGHWAPIFISNYQTAMANEEIPAYGGQRFSRIIRNAPNNPAGYQYRVVLHLAWWKPNGNLDGTAKVRLEWYHQERLNGGNGQNVMGYCIPSN